MKRIFSRLYQYIYTFFLMGVLMCLIILLSQNVQNAQAASPNADPRLSIEPSASSPFGAFLRGYYVYDSLPATQQFDHVHVYNNGKVPSTLHLSAVDATTGQTSGTVFRSSNDPQHDVGSWITLSRQEITLTPGQGADILFTLTIPAHVRPGQHGGGIVAEYAYQEPRVVNGNAVMVNIKSILALGVLVNLPGSTLERLNATAVQYDEKSHYQRLLVGLENVGTQLLHPSGNLLITDDQGHLLQNIPMKLNTFLPQTAIDYPVYIRHTALIPGKIYTVKLTMVYEGQHTLHYTTTIALPSTHKIPLINTNIDLVPTPGSTGSSFFWYYIAGGSALFLGLTVFLFVRLRRRHSS